MKKNLLLVGALVSAFLLASCSGGDKSKAPVVSTADIENAAEVIKYYNTSLGVLKDMVKEKDVNAVLDYMEQKGKAPALSAIVPPAVVSKDSAIVLNPGNCFNEETRQNLKQNYTGLFQARTEFYANFDTYLSYLKKKDVTNAKKLLDVNYQLSTQMSEYKQNIFDILSPFTEQAELVLLVDNPLKAQIMSVRKMSSTMQSILNLYARKHRMDGPRIDLKVAELTKQLDAAKKLPVVNGHEGEMKSYQAFLSQVETFIKQVKKVREKGEYSDAGICNLCNGAVTFVVKRDRKGLFRFVSLQSETGKSLLKRYAVESTNKTLYYFRNNRCYSKSTAILYILKDLGGFWQCLYPLILIPAKLRDAIYLLVSKYRYRIFGKADSCIKPFGFSSEESKRSD